MKIKISVILPIFKCEDYLNECLQSVRSQTFENIEIICVDDCTPDNSVNIVEHHALSDERIRIIRHERNLGLGGARNTGIRAATASFIAGVDADDRMHVNMLETLWNESGSGFYDIVNCGFNRITADGQLESTQRFPNRTYSNGNSLNIFGVVNPAFWNKLWRRSLFTENEIWFPHHLFYQDSVTTPRILFKACNIRLIEAVLYDYRIRTGSVTNTASPKHIIDYFSGADVLHDFLEKEGLEERYSNEILKFLDRALMHHAINGARKHFALEPAKLRQYLCHMLEFKLGYIECRNRLKKRPLEELMSMLQKARAYSDLGPSDRRVVLPVSIVIKTFLRPRHLERALQSIGEYQDAREIRFGEVLVGDDSPEPQRRENEGVIHRTQSLRVGVNVEYKTFETNIGLSEGRNRLVQEAKEKYVLICDDDYIFDKECDFGMALSALEKGEYDLVGGWLKNKYDLDNKTYQYWGSWGRITETADEIVINLNERALDRGRLIASDYLLNFFLARRDTLLSHPWDPTLKVEEHQEFFYRLKQSGCKSALSSDLFVKHPADPSDNPPEYNKYRFGKEHWERYLFLAPLKMGKVTRTFNRCRDDKFVRWTVDARKKTSRIVNIPLHDPILGQAVPIASISPRFEQQCFGGYYDVRLTSEDGRFTIFQTAPATDRLPKQTDISDILIVDRAGTIQKIGETSAWCHQQGSHAQFMYRSRSKVIYNIFDVIRSRFGATEIDISTGVEQNHSRPVSALSPDGASAASLNFPRLYDFRPGYGYGHIADELADDNSPKGDGVWLFDLNTGDERLIISYAKVSEFLCERGFGIFAGEKLVFNHVAFNTDGTKLLLLLRVFSDDVPFPTFTLVANLDGSALKLVFGFCSHYHWKDSDTIILSGFKAMKRDRANIIQVFEVNTASKKSRIVAPGMLDGDGHCSYSPNREYLLYDSYANKNFPYQRLQICRLSEERAVDLAYFYSPTEWFSNNPDLRCDLHPRWSPDGELITFDSIHEGFRGVYSISAADAIAAFDSQTVQSSKEELQHWYATKNNVAVAPGMTIGHFERFLRNRRKIYGRLRNLFRI